MLAVPDDHLDPTLPGWFAGDPPAEFVPLLSQMAADVRPESLRHQLLVMAEADQRDLLPRITVATLLIWGEQDVRSPLSIARQFEHAIPATTLVVIPDCGHVSNLEQPERINEAVREFCRATSPVEAHLTRNGFGESRRRQVMRYQNLVGNSGAPGLEPATSGVTTRAAHAKAV